MTTLNKKQKEKKKNPREREGFFKKIKNFINKACRKIFSKFRRKKVAQPKIVTAKKFTGNPIIKPSSYPWENRATFNTAAFYLDDKIHLFYRAIGEDDVSVLGYAYTYDGYNIEGRPTYSIFSRSFFPDKSKPSVSYLSGGGGFGGCEDPRVTIIDDTLYLIYTAFDGWGSIRVTITSLGLEDFRNKKWSNWSEPIILSPKNQIHKNWILFPEKINGKFAILHSISPEIYIDYIDDFKEFKKGRIVESIHMDHPKWKEKEPGVRGAGPTPIKTRLGWLVLYHKSPSEDPHKYKVYAKILDLKNPSKILYETDWAIVEPDQEYENEGHRGIVYTCGTVVKDNTLFIYYGGADKVVGVATMNLDELLDSMIKV